MRCPQSLMVCGQRWQVHASCKEGREQLMREIANRESTLPPLDRLVAERGNRRQGIWTTRALPCLHGPATWLHPGLPAHCALEGGPSSSSVHTLGRDSLPKMPNRPLVPISQRSEDPALFPEKAIAPPLKPHQRASLPPSRPPEKEKDERKRKRRTKKKKEKEKEVRSKK